MQPTSTEVAEISHRLLQALKLALNITTPSVAHVGVYAGAFIYALIDGFAPAAWAAGLESLKGLAAVPPATVFCFAVTLFSLSLWWTAQKSTSKRRGARFCGALVALAGLLTLSQYLGAWDVPINLWPFRGESG